MSKNSIAIFLLFFLCISCTFRKLAYRWADSYLLLQVDHFFSLDDTQKNIARAQIKNQLNWHKNHEMPRYEHFVAQVKTIVKNPLTAADTNWAFSQLIGFGNSISAHIAPEAAKFIVTLKGEQFDVLNSDNKKRNAKRFENYFSGEKKFTKMRVKDIRKYTMEWLGSVNTPQEESIANYVRAAWTFEQQRYENTFTSQRAFLDLIHRRKVAEIESHIADAFAFPQAYHSAVYRQAYTQHRNQLSLLFINLRLHATNEQMQYFQKKLDELQADFVEMQKTPF